jgi:hypothetical protein
MSITNRNSFGSYAAANPTEELDIFINNKPNFRELPLESPHRDIEVIDNFLTPNYVKKLQSVFFDKDFNWHYSPFVGEVTYSDRGLYFIHNIYENFRITEDKFDLWNGFLPILQALKVHSIMRLRALLYVNQGEIIEHEMHQDREYPHKTALLYLNDNNGYTGFEDGTKVESVCNRLVLFDGSMKHHSTTCSDAKERLVISINYF